MSFGRQKNMVRRAARPDESFYRDRRLNRVYRAAMLDGRSHRKSLFGRAVHALVRFLSRH
jgi:hypothetical protein